MSEKRHDSFVSKLNFDHKIGENNASFKISNLNKVLLNRKKLRTTSFQLIFVENSFFFNFTCV